MSEAGKKLQARGGDVGVRVKPLEWRETNDGNRRKGECFSTRSPVSFAPIAAHKTHDGWWLNVDCKTYPSLDAAKAAAQADYEARILAALEPAPDLAELVEAAEAERDALRERVARLEGAIESSSKIGSILGFLGEDDALIEAFREACGPKLWEKARAALTDGGKDG